MNYITVITNCTIKSEEFVRVFNEWGEYSTFKMNKLSVSNDIFHKEYMEKYLPNVDLEENIEWYRDTLKYCEIENKDDSDLNLKINITDEGNVNLWTQEEKDEYARIIKPAKEKGEAQIIPIKGICQGKENICGYGCVNNCIFRPIYINVYGKMFLDTFTSFTNQDNPENTMIMQSILEKDIYTIIKEWNEGIDKNKDVPAQEWEKDEFWNEIPDRMNQRLLEADALCKNGEFEKVEKILDEVEVYCSVLLNERQKLIEEFNNYIGKELENWNDPFEYAFHLMKNNPHKFEQIGLMEKMFDSEMFSKIITELENARNILEERKEYNMPGSIFEKPDLLNPIAFSKFRTFGLALQVMQGFNKLFNGKKD